VNGVIESRSGGIKFPDGSTQTTAVTGGNGNFIQNTTTQQASSNFNISGNGIIGSKLGIGTATPTGLLHVNHSSNFLTDAPIISGTADNVSLKIANGGTGGEKWVFDSTANTSGFGQGKLAIFPEVGVGGYAGTPTLTLQANGNVGIGTANATKGKVEINGGLNTGLSYSGGYLHTGGATTTLSLPGQNVSLYASGDIFANLLFAFSDERIKRIARRSDTQRDLHTLAGIEVTDYTYIDTIAKGTGKQKKVIAQQVEKVFPQAVSHPTDLVPDIYQKAEFKNGWVQLATNLRKGERVRLIGERQEGVYEVLEVASDKFRTDFVPGGTKADAAVFVYGREVKDFRVVDYEAISMLNVSATQELNRRMEQKDAEIKAIKAENEALNARLAALEQMLQQLLGQQPSQAQPSKRPQ
jgi:hypothetical protein